MQFGGVTINPKTRKLKKNKINFFCTGTSNDLQFGGVTINPKTQKLNKIRINFSVLGLQMIFTRNLKTFVPDYLNLVGQKRGPMTRHVILV